MMFREKVTALRERLTGNREKSFGDTQYNLPDIHVKRKQSAQEKCTIRESMKSDTRTYDAGPFHESELHISKDIIPKSEKFGGSSSSYSDEFSNYPSDGYHTDEEDHMRMYRRIQMREKTSQESDNALIPQTSVDKQQAKEEKAKRCKNLLRSRKKRSRWSDKVGVDEKCSTTNSRPNSCLTSVTRDDPALLNYAMKNYGTNLLSDDDWQKCIEHYKVNLIYQEMLRKREEIDRLAHAGSHKYDYDSDEDQEGGTWEHKLRTAEMEATTLWTKAINKQSEGKHHIGKYIEETAVCSD